MAVSFLLPIYGKNSNERYTGVKQVLMPSAGTAAEPVAPPQNNINGNLIYSRVASDAFPNTSFWSNLTATQIKALMDA
jgi:hypothetical protein